MLVSQIDNHVEQAIARFMAEYLSIPTQYSVNYPISDITLQVSGVTGMMAAFVDQIQELENESFDVNTGRQLWDGTSTPAIGAQLDGIGEIVGLKRNGLGDAEYTLFLFAEIAANFSRATILDIFTCASYLFNTTQIFIQNYEPATVAIEVAGSQLPSSLNAQAAALLRRVVAGGVGIIFVAETTQPNAFRFSSAVYPTPNVDNINNGFSSAADPTDFPGGDFVGVIS